MIILLEGPDGSGKSTLAKRLAEELGATTQHCGNPPVLGIATGPAENGGPYRARQAAHFWWQLRGLELQNPSAAITVVDRSWPSEQIYHDLVGRPHFFTRPYERMFERYLLTHGGVIVKCLPPYHVAKANWLARSDRGGELVNDTEAFTEIYNRYAAWHFSAVVMNQYDYTSPWQQDHIVDVMRQLHASQPTCPPRFAGNYNAPILIVGERYNLTKVSAAGPHLPFVGTGTNGRWLAQRLDEMGLSENQLCWVNAQQEDGSPTAYLGLKAFPVVITLGKVAESWVADAGPLLSQAAVFKAPHPAYWTCFHGRETWPLTEWREAIFDAAGCNESF